MKIKICSFFFLSPSFSDFPDTVFVRGGTPLSTKSAPSGIYVSNIIAQKFLRKGAETEKNMAKDDKNMEKSIVIEIFC